MTQKPQSNQQKDDEQDEEADDEEQYNEIESLADNVIGKTLGGRYKVLDVLGAGGMSVILLGRDALTNQNVALKTLKPSILNEPLMVGRFQREIVSLAKLDHPNVVNVQDCVTDETGQPFIVMEYLHGITLEDLLKQEGRLTPQRLYSIFRQICLALEHVHAEGVIHKDLKPANVMLVSEGHKEVVKLFDFGLAKVVEDTFFRQTAKGTVVGSAPYMSPEQCRSENDHKIDERSDVYQLGAVMYEAFIGREPFQSARAMDTLIKHIKEYPPSFAEAAPDLDVPDGFEAIVFISMAKNQDHRFQNMDELRSALDAVFGQNVEEKSKLVTRHRELLQARS